MCTARTSGIASRWACGNGCQSHWVTITSCQSYWIAIFSCQRYMVAISSCQRYVIAISSCQTYLSNQRCHLDLTIITQLPNWLYKSGFLFIEWILVILRLSEWHELSSIVPFPENPEFYVKYIIIMKMIQNVQCIQK